jgi:uncharacterized protein YndB with AHSA1/START domain
VTEGVLEEIDGRPALRFIRRLGYPIERVWRAVSTKDELAAWFVAPMEFTGVGQRFEVMDQRGEVLRYDPPRALEWEWGGERFSFDLEPDGDGTLLTFIHVIAQRDRAADYAAGWHFHLDRLEAHLAGQTVPEGEAAQLIALNDTYSERFGLDPDVGRRSIAEYYGSTSPGTEQRP